MGSTGAAVVVIGNDSDSACQSLTGQLMQCKSLFTACSSLEEANGARILALVSTVITDELISAVDASSKSQRVIVVLTREIHCDWNGLVELISRGAHDVLFAENGSISTELLGRVERLMAVEKLIEDQRVFQRAVGRSRPWINVVRRLVEVAHFTSDTVLLQGASGSGKDLLARLIHDLDCRGERGRFVILDCTTVVPELAGSEFFGHEKGAFTGAISSRVGVFGEADRGTLFLDEVGELPFPLQAQLLRVIQEGTYRRVGSNTWYQTRFRLVCATNKNLIEEVEAGRFRRDLYYRMAQWTFQLPSLLERAEDIPLLINHFLRTRFGKDRAPVCDSLVQNFLCSRHYPGNVRELRQLVERLCLLRDKARVISAGCIPSDEWESACACHDNNGSNGIHSFVRGALDRSLSLEQITTQSRIEAIKGVMIEEFEKVGSDPSRRGEVMIRTADRLKCSRRWIQKCSRELKLFQAISKTNGSGE